MSTTLVTLLVKIVLSLNHPLQTALVSKVLIVQHLRFHESAGVKVSMLVIVRTVSLTVKTSWIDSLCCRLMLKTLLVLLLGCCTSLQIQEICRLVGQHQDGTIVYGVMLGDWSNKRNDRGLRNVP